jgi:hypothetical protein
LKEEVMIAMLNMDLDRMRLEALQAEETPRVPLTKSFMWKGHRAVVCPRCDTQIGCLKVGEAMKCYLCTEEFIVDAETKPEIAVQADHE